MSQSWNHTVFVHLEKCISASSTCFCGQRDHCIFLAECFTVWVSHGLFIHSPRSPPVWGSYEESCCKYFGADFVGTSFAAALGTDAGVWSLDPVIRFCSAWSETTKLTSEAAAPPAPPPAGDESSRCSSSSRALGAVSVTYFWHAKRSVTASHS